jgi:hypothetical protein
MYGAPSTVIGWSVSLPRRKKHVRCIGVQGWAEHMVALLSANALWLNSIGARTSNAPVLATKRPSLFHTSWKANGSFVFGL